MAEGTHRGQQIELYGVLKKLIELQYNSTLEFHRSVVQFRCDWYNHEGKAVGIRDDKYFKSINIQSMRYKSDPFILATQSTKIFSWQYNALGKDLRVVQKFEYRGMYNVPEMDDDVIHQHDYCSDTTVHEGDEHAADVHHVVNGEDTIIIEGNLEDLLRNKEGSP